MTSRRHVVIVAAAAPANTGGLPLATAHVCRALEAIGYRLSVIAPEAPTGSEALLPVGVRHLTVPAGRFYSPRFALAIRAALRSLIGEGDIHAVVSQSAAGFPLLGICQQQGIPFIFHAHGTALREYEAARSRLHRLYRRALVELDRLVLPQVSAIAAVSRPIARELRTFLGHRSGVPVEYVPNGVPVDEAASLVRSRPALRSRLGVEPSKRIVLFLGRLSADKCPADLLLAMPHAVTDAASPVELWIAGDGPLRSQLERIASGSLPAGTFRFWGRLSRSEVARVLAASDLLVLPSGRREGMPYVILEAHSVGIPVLVSDALDIGRPDLPTFRHGDPRCLGKAIARALKQAAPIERLIAVARREHSLEAQGRAFGGLLNRFRSQ